MDNKSQERIKADAAKFTDKRYKSTGVSSKEYARHMGILDGLEEGYIAGATAVHAHVQPVIEAAEKVAKLFAHKGDHQTCAICQLARALEQWKDGKEVEPVKPVASNCGMCGKLGNNQYLGNQFYLCDECFEDYEKGRDQPTPY